MKKNFAVANLNKLLNNFLNWQFRPPPLQNQPSITHAKPLKMNVKPPLISEPDVMEFLLDAFGDQSKKQKIQRVQTVIVLWCISDCELGYWVVSLSCTYCY